MSQVFFVLEVVVFAIELHMSNKFLEFQNILESLFFDKNDKITHIHTQLLMKFHHRTNNHSTHEPQIMYQIVMGSIKLIDICLTMNYLKIKNIFK